MKGATDPGRTDNLSSPADRLTQPGYVTDI